MPFWTMAARAWRAPSEATARSWGWIGAGIGITPFIARLKQIAHERTLTDLNKNLTYTNVVVYPERADKKVYPVRWLIVVGSVASACFLCLVLLMLRDRRRVLTTSKS